MNISRRIFLASSAVLFCAPAIVRAESLMKIAEPKIIMPNTISFTVSGLTEGSNVTVYHANDLDGGVSKVSDSKEVTFYLDKDKWEGDQVIVTSRDYGQYYNQWRFGMSDGITLHAQQT